VASDKRLRDSVGLPETFEGSYCVVGDQIVYGRFCPVDITRDRSLRVPSDRPD
jgi:hypothetical protein